MVIDKLIEQIIAKRNPSVVGIDPEWSKIPECYKTMGATKADAIKNWAKDIIDTISDIVPAVKPQMAFFEVFGADVVAVFEYIVSYAHKKGLIVIDDSKQMISEIQQVPMHLLICRETAQSMRIF